MAERARALSSTLTADKVKGRPSARTGPRVHSHSFRQVDAGPVRGRFVVNAIPLRLGSDRLNVSLELQDQPTIGSRQTKEQGS